MHPVLLLLGMMGAAHHAAKAEKTEEARLKRVVRRVLYHNGRLSDYEDPYLGGVFAPNGNSASSDAVPSYQHFGRWDGEEFQRTLRYKWPEAMRSEGLSRLYTWVSRNRFKGTITGAAWAPDMADKVAKAYPPKRIIYGNMHFLPDFRIGQCGREFLVAIIDCESDAQVKQLTDAFGPVHPFAEPPGEPHDMRPFKSGVIMTNLMEENGLHGFVDLRTMAVTFCAKGEMRARAAAGKVRGVDANPAWASAELSDADLFTLLALRGVLAFSQEGERMSFVHKNGVLNCAVLTPAHEAVMRRFAAKWSYAFAKMSLIPALDPVG